MKKVLLPILVVLLIIVAAAAVYFYQKYTTLTLSPESKDTQQVEDILSKVGKLILLPQGEVPTIATVSDLSKLKDQPFFAKAKLGDKVLLYPKSKKAYLYDPVNNKILEVAPIDLGTVAKTPTPEAVPAPLNTAKPQASTTTTKTTTKK